MPLKPPPHLYLTLALLVSLCYSLPALSEALSGEYVIQDDARQHIFWMRRFLDPALFSNDLMADYFQSVAPWGYTTLYRLFAIVGVDPVLLSKLLPPLLGLIVTGFCFGVGMQLLPLPIAGFTTATLLNQNLWMRDDLSSATPGAFFYPIFLAFLYFLLRGALFPTLFTIALQGLFYPQSVFLAAGILVLRLSTWSNQESERGLGRLRLADRATVKLSLAGLGMAAGVIGLYALKSSEFGSVIGLAAARQMPAFGPRGWSAFFSDSWVDFWLCGKRSGIIPTEWCDLAKDSQEVPRLWLAMLRFPVLWLGPILPLLVWWSRRQQTSLIFTNLSILWQGLLVSTTLFFVAHSLAFKLHLPNRYTEHSYRVLLALAAGISLVILWEWLSRWFQAKVNRIWSVGITVLLASSFVFYPYSLEIDHAPFPVTGYFKGEHPALYRFFAKQPKDIVIASLSEEANQIPTFSQRSLLVGGEGYVLPYHPQYFQQVSQKLLALVQAQYSPDLNQVKALIQDYQIDFWLLDQDSFQPDFADPKAYLTSVFEQFPAELQQVKDQIKAGTAPALTQIPNNCTAFEKQRFYILRAKCILRSRSPAS